MNPDQQTIFHEEEGIDIKKYIFLILSHWWWFAVSIFIALTIAYLVNRYSQQVYQASCSVIVEDESASGSVENILDELSRVRNNRRKAIVSNEISILKSYKLAHMAMEELDFNVTYTAVGRRGIAEAQMYTRCPFMVISDTNRENILNHPVNVTILSEKEYLLEINDGMGVSQHMQFGEPYLTDVFNFTIYIRDTASFRFNHDYSNKYYFVFNSVHNLSNAYRNALRVDLNDEKGSVFTLTLQGPVETQLTDYLNKFSEVYIRSALEEKNRTATNTIKFIDDQLRGIVDSLEAAGIRLQNFRSSNRLINISEEGQALFKQLEELQTNKNALFLRASYYEYILKTINEKKDFSDIIAPSVMGVADELLNSLVAQLNKLSIEKHNLGFSVQENSPQVGLLATQIKNTRDALQENVRNLINANQVAIASLNKQIGLAESKVQRLPSTERQLINIQREFNINDQIYTFLLQKRAEAGIAKASNTSNKKVLDLALPENAVRIKPKTSTNYMIALVSGGFFPLFILILINFFNTRINDRRDIEEKTNVPVVGSIGHCDKSSELPVFEFPRSTLAESFRGLRTNLQYLLKEKGQKVISISSTISGEGKTFVAVNLASIIAMSGKKTLLVSLDLRRPKVHRVFNLNNKTGLSTYLIHKSAFQEIILPTNIENLHIATSGPTPPNPAELLGSEQMAVFFKEAVKNYDMIVIDTPPVAVVTDALLLNAFVDTQIFVIRQNFSNKQVLDLVNDLFDKKKLSNLSLVINDIQVSGYNRYNYKYGYDYGYSYYNKDYYESEVTEKGIWQIIKKAFLKKIIN